MGNFQKSKIFKSALCVSLILTLIFFIDFSNLSHAKDDVIKIGVICPMTGSGAQWGKRMSSGALLRAEEENKAGGINGKMIEIVVEDHKGIPREGVAGANRLIHVEKAPAFMVTYSGVVMATIPLAQQNKKVLLNTAALNPNIRKGGEWIFSIMPLGDLEGKAQVDFIINELGLKKAGVMYINNAFGVSMAEVVKKEFEKAGGKILLYEGHEQGGTDFKSVISKMKQKEPEVIFLESYYMESGLIVKQAEELGLTGGVTWISYAGVQQPQFIEIAGQAGEGFICTVAGWDPDDPRQIVKDFKKNIKEKYGVDGEMYSAMTYDGMKLLAEAMRKYGTTPADIQKGLNKIKNFDGVTGTNVYFDEDGMVVKKLLLNQLKNGKWVKYKK
jgi:branched-chain amino acid transport system substrate-binding protein